MSLSKTGAPPSFTWTTLPTVANWPSFSPVFITDIGAVDGVTVGSLWYHNGTRWYPENGEFTLAMGTGTVAAPLATIAAGSTYPKCFTLPGGAIQVPANLLRVGSQVLIEAILNKVGVNGEATFGAVINTVDGIVTGSAINTTHGQLGLSAAQTGGWMFSRHVYGGTTTITRMPNLPPADATTVLLGDSSININTAALQYFSIGVLSGAHAVDAFAIAAYRVVVAP